MRSVAVGVGQRAHAQDESCDQAVAEPGTKRPHPAQVLVMDACSGLDFEGIGGRGAEMADGDWRIPRLAVSVSARSA
ncbi:hypothetical protein [Dactylosporangium sp. NPDC051484]|uniref:hypothetical protein n=1 Tax=Dactylosporangium sp. NPDC051484 TaxID=3154942 RepID=UPI00344EA5E9